MQKLKGYYLKKHLIEEPVFPVMKIKSTPLHGEGKHLEIQELLLKIQISSEIYNYFGK